MNREKINILNMMMLKVTMKMMKILLMN